MCAVWPSHSKWMSEQSNESASNLALSLNIPLQKLLRWFRSPQLWAWWLVASSQHICSRIMSCAEFFGKISNHSGDSALLQPRFGDLQLLAFRKTKSPLKRKTFQTVSEIQENTTGQLTAVGRTMWGPKVPTLKGIEVSLLCIQCFLYLL